MEANSLARRTISTLILLTIPLVFAAQSRAQAIPAHPPEPVATQSAPPTGLAQVQNEAAQWLLDLIKINTTNPPGNELAAAKYIAAVLDREGIHSETIESAPGRGFLVARLSSSPLPDPSRALLLMAHLDVVGVDRSKWTVDPFGGVIEGNYLYGRGAIDDKGMLAANLAAFVALKRSGARLNRDVIFFAEGDEEDGGAQGIKFAVTKHWDKIAAGFAINEGGRIALKNGKVQYVGIQASEKVAANIDVIAKGTSGHASVPLKDNAVAHLAAALAKISTYEAPVEFNSITRAYFAALAPVEDDETAKWIRVLETPERGDHAARVISDANPLWNSMIHDTISPTMLQAGVRQNVIPAEAKAVLNVRLLPGNQLSVLIAELQLLVNDPAIRFEVEPNGSEIAPSSLLATELYASIKRVAGNEFQ